MEIVNETDEPVASGNIGRIRMRGSDVVTAYLGANPEPNGCFRDGWFYSGDLGRLRADGMLCVDGREDEVMNFGGEKFLPKTLEEPVRAVPGVADVAAFALEDDSSIAQPWLAIVRDGDIADGAIGGALPMPGLPPVHIAWIDSLPLSPLGKVRREVLREAARNLSASA